MDACVSKVKAGWQKDPTTKPKKTKDGKPVKTPQDLESVAWAICQSSMKAEATLQRVMLEGIGPVILGVALTNRPHLPLPKVSIVDKNGEKMFRVPFLCSGIFKHPDGQLVFNQETMQRMLENHKKKASHYGVSVDVRHKPEMGALGWFDAEEGGSIEQEEDTEFGKLLVGYSKLTEDAEKVIAGKKYLYASAEFAPNYESNLVEALSSDKLREVTLEELLQEETMTYPIKNEDGTVVLSAELFVAYEKAAATITALEEKVTGLEEKVAKATTTQEPDLPEPARKRLEESDRQVQALRKRVIESEVNAAIERARNYRDKDGRAHSPVMLEWAANLMRGEPVGTGEDVIKLEDGNSPGSVIEYVHKAVRYLLSNLPGQVPMEARTQGDERRMEENATKVTKEDFKAFWS